MSGVRIFGTAAGSPPTAPTAAAKRTSPLDAQIECSPTPGAVEYLVRYGIGPDRLYSSWQTPDTKLRLGSLNAGQTYWVAVDAINTSGITRGSAIPIG